ncbi:hypothetical protein PV350_40585 [Streptomyces sp. PA03-6a]|nr:hypothetical protein [Streptomyces sp. PA03-6a]
MGEQYGDFSRRLRVQLPVLVEGAGRLGDSCRQCALQIEYAKFMIVGMLAWTAAEIVQLAWWAPEAVPALISGARAMVLLILRRLVAGVAAGAVFGLTLDGVIQALQMLRGDRTRWDVSSMRDMVLGGALEGGVVGGFRGVGAAVAPKFEKSLLGGGVIEGTGTMVSTGMGNAAFHDNSNVGDGFTSGMVEGMTEGGGGRRGGSTAGGGGVPEIPALNISLPPAAELTVPETDDGEETLVPPASAVRDRGPAGTDHTNVGVPAGVVSGGGTGGQAGPAWFPGRGPETGNTPGTGSGRGVVTSIPGGGSGTATAGTAGAGTGAMPVDRFGVAANGSGSGPGTTAGSGGSGTPQVPGAVRGAETSDGASRSVVAAAGPEGSGVGSAVRGDDTLVTDQSPASGTGAGAGAGAGVAGFGDHIALVQNVGTAAGLAGFDDVSGVPDVAGIFPATAVGGPGDVRAGVGHVATPSTAALDAGSAGAGATDSVPAVVSAGSVAPGAGMLTGTGQGVLSPISIGQSSPLPAHAAAVTRTSAAGPVGGGSRGTGAAGDRPLVPVVGEPAVAAVVLPGVESFAGTGMRTRPESGGPDAVPGDGAGRGGRGSHVPGGLHAAGTAHTEAPVVGHGGPYPGIGRVPDTADERADVAGAMVVADADADDVPGVAVDSAPTPSSSRRVSPATLAEVRQESAPAALPHATGNGHLLPPPFGDESDGPHVRFRETAATAGRFMRNFGVVTNDVNSILNTAWEYGLVDRHVVQQRYVELPKHITTRNDKTVAEAIAGKLLNGGQSLAMLGGASRWKGFFRRARAREDAKAANEASIPVVAADSGVNKAELAAAVGSSRPDSGAELMVKLERTYGVSFNSDLGVAEFKRSYFNLPQEVIDRVKVDKFPVEWLPMIDEALGHFAPIMGARRDESSRSGTDQEINTLSAVEWGLSGPEEPNSWHLGEMYCKKKLINVFTGPFKRNFRDPSERINGVLGVVVHEVAHGLLDYAMLEFEWHFWDGVKQSGWKEWVPPSGSIDHREALRELIRATVFRLEDFQEWAPPNLAQETYRLLESLPGNVRAWQDETKIQLVDRLTKALEAQPDTKLVLQRYDALIQKNRRFFVAEQAITKYGTVNAFEDLAESARYYFLDKETLRERAPRRAAFMDRLVKGWSERASGAVDTPAAPQRTGFSSLQMSPGLSTASKSRVLASALDQEPAVDAVGRAAAYNGTDTDAAPVDSSESTAELNRSLFQPGLETLREGPTTYQQVRDRAAKEQEQVAETVRGKGRDDRVELGLVQGMYREESASHEEASAVALRSYLEAVQEQERAAAAYEDLFWRMERGMEGGQSLNQESFEGAVKTAEQVLEKAERAAGAAREELERLGIDLGSLNATDADLKARPRLVGGSPSGSGARGHHSGVQRAEYPTSRTLGTVSDAGVYQIPSGAQVPLPGTGFGSGEGVPFQLSVRVPFQGGVRDVLSREGADAVRSAAQQIVEEAVVCWRRGERPTLRIEVTGYGNGKGGRGGDRASETGHHRANTTARALREQIQQHLDDVSQGPKPVVEDFRIDEISGGFSDNKQSAADRRSAWITVEFGRSTPAVTSPHDGVSSSIHRLALESAESGDAGNHGHVSTGSRATPQTPELIRPAAHLSQLTLRRVGEMQSDLADRRVRLKEQLEQQKAALGRSGLTDTQRTIYDTAIRKLITLDRYRKMRPGQFRGRPQADQQFNGLAKSEASDRVKLAAYVSEDLHLWRTRVDESVYSSRRIAEEMINLHMQTQENLAAIARHEQALGTFYEYHGAELMRDCRRSIPWSANQIEHVRESGGRSLDAIRYRFDARTLSSGENLEKESGISAALAEKYKTGNCGELAQWLFTEARFRFNGANIPVSIIHHSADHSFLGMGVRNYPEFRILDPWPRHQEKPVTAEQYNLKNLHRCYSDDGLTDSAINYRTWAQQQPFMRTLRRPPHPNPPFESRRSAVQWVNNHHPKARDHLFDITRATSDPKDVYVGPRDGYDTDSGDSISSDRLRKPIDTPLDFDTQHHS